MKLINRKVLKVDHRVEEKITIELNNGKKCNYGVIIKNGKVIDILPMSKKDMGVLFDRSNSELLEIEKLIKVTCHKQKVK